MTQKKIKDLNVGDVIYALKDNNVIELKVVEFKDSPNLKSYRYRLDFYNNDDKNDDYFDIGYLTYHSLIFTSFICNKYNGEYVVFVNKNEVVNILESKLNIIKKSLDKLNNGERN